MQIVEQEDDEVTIIQQRAQEYLDQLHELKKSFVKSIDIVQANGLMLYIIYSKISSELLFRIN